TFLTRELADAWGSLTPLTGDIELIGNLFSTGKPKLRSALLVEALKYAEATRPRHWPADLQPSDYPLGVLPHEAGAQSYDDLRQTGRERLGRLLANHIIGTLVKSERSGGAGLPPQLNETLFLPFFHLGP